MTRKQSYSEYLADNGYNYFFTLTTQYHLTLKSARRLAERVISNWKKLDPTIKVFWVAERYKNKAGYHLHGMFAVREDLTDKLWYQNFLNAFQRATGVEQWQRIDLRRIHEVREGTKSKRKWSEKPSAYCSKYIVKKSVDYDFHFPSNMVDQNGYFQQKFEG